MLRVEAEHEFKGDIIFLLFFRSLSSQKHTHVVVVLLSCCDVIYASNVLFLEIIQEPCRASECEKCSSNSVKN